ncbi:hypothetical protein BDR22DRAFT_819622 [Usnea florida]
MHSSLRILALISLLAKISGAAFINTSISTNSSSEKAAANASIRGLPNPGTTPAFDYDFNVIFEGGRCSASQQATILETMAYVAGLSDRIKLWEEDSFHDWQPEVKYWFGENPQSKDAWIKSNAALFSV